MCFGEVAVVRGTESFLKKMKCFFNRIVKPSTRAFIREAARTPGYSFFDFLHGYIYARWIYLYIDVATGQNRFVRLFRAGQTHLGKRLDRMLLHGDHEATHAHLKKKLKKAHAAAETYHGKVLPLPLAEELVHVHKDIRLLDLEKVIPYSKARDIVLKNPDHIAVLDCACRKAKEHPCLPLDVCLVVGEPFASMVVEHHPKRSRWISSDEAVAILKSEHEQGHVHHAFFKDAMLGRFYAICNCCACCCGAMQANRQGIPMLASSGYIATISTTKCTRCLSCQRHCPFSALTEHEGSVSVNKKKCMGCGICTSVCKPEAISMVREPSKGVPLSIQHLTGGVV